jgi:hypothetical protein
MKLRIEMKLKDIVSQLANRINQPHVIEVYLRQVYAKGFVDGTKQFPWISVKDRVPIPIIEAIDGNEYGSIDVLGAIQNSYGDYDYYICRYWGYNKEYRWENGIAPDYWMPIPKFNEE